MPQKELKLASPLLLTVVLLISWSLVTSACSDDDTATDCKGCILNRMKYDCPSCVRTLRCMAKCLWAGTPRIKCTKRCDCNEGYPRLSDCKKCMSKCKCSCVS